MVSRKAVQANVPPIETLFVNKSDTVLSSMGSKGMGEVVVIGLAPAVANAVFHVRGNE
ncbi:MAG: hypothetical protein M3342_05355 [Bacteroidota bacterium]|nr:hypothetical protein [Bacteroidota bacterium]